MTDLATIVEQLKERPCEGCKDEHGKPVMIKPVLGTGSDGKPVAVWQHGDAFDGKPHWKRETPIKVGG